ncbi:OmpA family protein [Sulfurimonas marina]|uniref:OmpA family protein n=1 Tax=Sulfurimonas marina TaxID=2590551 RepID=A0A7M1B0R0_9BACT|nr:OmpA family protein [Sulfurimonas marina]QOP42232.1 OmpA family protein [Sulfurimonas marina]
MKKFLLLSALVSSVLLAEQKQYEISPMIGYDLTEGNIDIKNNGHFLGGLEIQFNSPNSKISPEFSILYSPKAKYEASGDSSITRGAFNGVYTFDTINNFVPFAKAGIGIENVGNETEANQDGFFLDAGAGAKYFFSENLALKAEAIYLAKYANQNAGHFDSNLIAMVGLTFAFGDSTQPQPKEEPKQEVVKEEPVVTPEPVDGDDDNDGVLNSKDQCPASPANVTVDTNGCEVDSDNDGIVDSKDQCPKTKLGVKVDENGCDIDTDKDGVVNAKDICPNTPLGADVNDEGCPKEVTLNINFATNSSTIKESSSALLDQYAKFLTTYTNYSAHIVGHTDDRGAAAYNKKLSEKRANAVVQALIAKGVDPKQLTSEGMGEEKPVADNKTAEGRSQNRRIEAQLTRH